jgi:DNA-binding NtrC family response regulator
MIRPQRLILIEPDAGVRDAILRLLQTEGWEVYALADTTTLDSVIEKDGIQVVVSEFTLPDMAATELLEQCKKIAIPVIFIGHNFSLQAAMDVIRQGALDFLEKPFSRSRLIDLLSNVTTGKMSD